MDYRNGQGTKNLSIGIEQPNFPETFQILGVRVHGVDALELLSLAEKWVKESSPRTILYVNAHCLNIARRDIDYRAVLNRADLVYADGISVVWSSRFLGFHGHIQKATGADWIQSYCRQAEESGLKSYILAGKPGIASKAKSRLIEKYPGLRVTGVCDGFFIEKDEKTVLMEISESRPDVVFVGRGTPLQEKWIADNRTRISAPVCWGVGALFDYIAGVERRVPSGLNRIGLEWLWRLLEDPRGKWRRYLVGNLSFLYHVFCQKVDHLG
jgi:N-acetylglucosaminyldiphosphoundecaprenol N-acetyl-beta-D-mannosaminyltransferase